MDPDANLREQRELAADIIRMADAGDDYEPVANKGTQLAELVQALDEWLRRGGRLPAEWEPSGYLHTH